MTNQEISAKFFDSIVDVLAKNTSKNYSLVVLGKMKKEMMQLYPFFKFVHFDSGKVKIEAKINETSSHKLGKLFMDIIEVLGPSLLKVMIMEELDTKTVKYLERIGVKFLDNV